MKASVIAVLILIFNFSNAQGANCKFFQLKWYDSGKENQKSQKLCKEGEYQIYSENCLNDNCRQLRQNFKVIPVSQIYKSFGTPAANLCNFIGGSPALYEIKIDSDWQEIDLCTFKDDNSIINSSYLFEKYKGIIK